MRLILKKRMAVVVVNVLSGATFKSNDLDGFHSVIKKDRLARKIVERKMYGKFGSGNSHFLLHTQ